MSCSRGVLVIRTRLGTIGQVHFQRRATPAGLDLIQFRQVATEGPGESCEPFNTLLIDLTQPLDDLFAAIRKDTRYEIRRAADRDDLMVEFSITPDLTLTSEFCDGYNEFAAAKHLPNISRSLVNAYAAAGVLRLSRIRTADLRCTVWHAYLHIDDRARLQFSASPRRNLADPTTQALYGRANRLLHWRDIQRFKELGVATYDLGGRYAGTSDASRSAVSSFKEQFGGARVQEYNCRQALTWRGFGIIFAEELVEKVHSLQRRIYIWTKRGPVSE